ncbi:MAG: hypothetical protein IJ088_14090, partial [Clostridia bacterium]|nr:hypothetical protein [Clostridia bacterium]
VLYLCFLILLSLSCAAENSDASEEAQMPQFLRSLPISDDDPARRSVLEDQKMPYQYGLVYSDVNDSSEEGMTEDTGVLIGGNAISGHDGFQEDNDRNDFNGIFPYTDIYINPNRLNYRNGMNEYTFYSDQFQFNSTGKIDPGSISIQGVNTVISEYRQLLPDPLHPGYLEPDNATDWRGVVYTGGIARTVSDEQGNLTETVVRNEDASGNSRLFSVRYKEAVTDRNGHSYDLVLMFTQITFVADADVHGALPVMEENSLRISPTLWDGTAYTVKGIANDPEGVRIGARYEFDYSIQDRDGRMPVGSLMFSVEDLDKASMATVLAPGASWGINEKGSDFRWAEGFAIVKGAQSYAISPYFNHVLTDSQNRSINNGNGDSRPIRISRLPGTQTDGTCNGLLFTTSVTAVSGQGTRDDSNTMDTGFAALIQPSGSMLATLSSGRLETEKIALFDIQAAYRIQKSSSNGGTVVSIEEENGHSVENTSVNRVVGGGQTVSYSIMPDEEYAIYSIRIDEKRFRFSNLKWRRLLTSMPTAQYEIDEQYGRWATSTTYTFTRQESGKVVFSFDNIQDNHEVYVEFMPISQIPNDLEFNTAIVGHRRIRTTQKIAIFLIASLAALVCAATILWMRGDGGRK